MSDEAVIALAGVLAGGVVSVATVLVAPLVSARIAGQRFREQLLAKAVEDVAAILGTAGLALEEFHWALERTVGGLEHGVRDAEMDDYRSALKAAQSDHLVSVVDLPSVWGRRKNPTAFGSTTRIRVPIEN